MRLESIDNQVTLLKEAGAELARGLDSLRKPGADPENWPEDLERDLYDFATQADNISTTAGEIARDVEVALAEREEAREAAKSKFKVGVNGDPPILLREFDTEAEASEFIGTLLGASEGLYYLDPPSDDA